MNLGTATLLLGGAIGLALALFGVVVLVTGRAPASTVRNFPTVPAAALYHLLFGLALLLLVAGQALFAGPARTATSVAAIALVGVALVRYRPRRRKPVDGGR
ncbi:hypothetical protein GCM10020358_03740 [Amorphoplanes nipponensis]|uniref:Uncharacterized protein n=1 Tax=Actinoplanes nipponensis TaxID=135950 RepID=A0A919JNP6_9ACTN|nr:hypothetical protein [Actinoplanes nipponensis]GIE52652.1 hypothetical protein Ani05nite_61860 [Actinoplanes nipponensis]